MSARRGAACLRPRHCLVENQLLRCGVRSAFLLGLSFFVAAELSRAATADSGADPLATLRAGHPRLLLTDEVLAAVTDAARSDPLRSALHARIIATAESLLAAPAAKHIPASNASLDQARYAVHTILTCALAYRLNGDARFLARAKRELLTVAAFPDWNPGHFLDVGETGFAVAIGYDWLFAQLDADERAALRRAMIEHALRPALVAYHPGERKDRAVEWASATSNWNQVCNSGVLCAALVLADEEPELARNVIAGARVSIPRGLAAYAPDGQYPEGPGYWTFGTTYSVIALAALHEVLGTELGLAEAPGFSRTADYPLAVQGPAGRVFNYADCTEDVQNSPARAWLARRFGNATALRATRALLADSLGRERATPFDPTIQAQVVNRFFPLHALWFPGENSAAVPAGTAPAASAAELPLDLHLRGVADLAIFRSAWDDPRAVFVGFKAGENAVRHNHLDLGSFVLDADGVRWASDLGPETYELPGFFDYKERRWAFFRANNFSHNTVTPGGALQKRKVIAPIVAFGSTPQRAFAVADLTPAYPDEAAGLRRGIALLDRSQLLVQDEFAASRSGVPLRWVMLTRARIEIGDDDRVARLTSEGRELRVQILEPAAAKFRGEPARPPTAAENQNDGCTLLVTEIAGGEGRGAGAGDVVRLAVLLTPVGERWPQLPPPPVRPLSEW